jgi:hypothetical protein
VVDIAKQVFDLLVPVEGTQQQSPSVSHGLKTGSFSVV